MTEILLTGTLNLNSINQSIKNLLEKLELNFVYNFHQEHIVLILKKKLSLKIDVKNIKIQA